MQDVSQTIISQYANSPVLGEILANWNADLDPQQFADALYDNIWNIETATGYGLDVWGRIVGVSRALNVAASNYFGFYGVAAAVPFNAGPFFDGTHLTTNYVLTDSSFRTLIYAKALANIWDGSIPGLNKILLTLFPGRGNCYVAVPSARQMVFTFTFTLSNVELGILTNSGVLPVPAGVTATVSVP